MLRQMKTISVFLTCGAITILTAACEGIAFKGECFVKKVTVVDSQGQPVPDLQLNVTGKDTAISENTDSKGMANLELCDQDAGAKIIITIEDIDGESNGSVKSKTITLDASNQDETIVVETAA